MPETALVVTDMVSSFDFEDGDALRESAREAAPRMALLIRRAHEQDVPVIWVNDNFGQWNLTREDLVGQVADEFLEELKPDSGAPFFLKGRHSIFYGTSVEHLLREMGVERIVLIGQVTEQCILYSALDAYLRHFQVVVPRDAVASIHQHLSDAALEMMERNLHAEIVDAESCEL